MNQETTRNFQFPSSSCESIKKTNIFSVHSILQPITSNVNATKNQKKIPLKIKGKYPKKLTNLSNSPKSPDSNEMICDTSDDSQNEKSTIKAGTKDLIGKESSEEKCKPSASSLATSLSFNFCVPSFLNDKARISANEANMRRYHEVCKKYLYLEDRDFYLINSEGLDMKGNSLNELYTSAYFDEDLFFNFDN